MPERRPDRSTLRVRSIILTALVILSGLSAHADTLVRYRVDGDRITAPLDPGRPDPARGRAVLLNRETGNCLICHRLDSSSERSQGEIGPPLDGVGARLDAGQLRLRLVDQSRLNPDTLMPPYYRVDGLTRVAPKFAGKPALSVLEIEDVIAYLATLK